MSENPSIEPGYPRPGDSLKARVWFRMLSLEQKTLLGTLFFFIILLILAWTGLSEAKRMQEYDNQYIARSIQRGAGIFDSTCSPCHGKRGEGVPGVAPTLNRPDEFNGTRLKELGYGGTLKDYFTLTISAGRPARSNPDWPNPMPTWSQDYGGPLRPDQIGDVVNYVMNWGCGYNPKYDPICQGVDKSFDTSLLPTAGPSPTAAPTTPPVSIADIVSKLPPGDAARGETIFNGTTAITGAPACKVCHTVDGSPLVGPSLQGVASRIPPPDYKVPEGVSDPKVYYLAESIYEPNVYKAKGFESGAMFGGFSKAFSPDYKDLADVIAYLLTLK